MSTKTATQYTEALARALSVAGPAHRTWNQRYIAALEAEGLTLSLVSRRGPQYPDRVGTGNISAAAPKPYGTGPIRWAPADKVYVVWSEDLV